MVAAMVDVFGLRQWLHGGGWAAQVGGGMVAEGCLLVAMCAGCRRFLVGWGSKGSWIWRSLAVQVLESLVADGGCVGRQDHGGSGRGDWGTWWLLGQQQGGGSYGSATRGQRCNGARRQQCNGGNEGGFSGGSSHIMAAWWQYFSGARRRQRVDWHGRGFFAALGQQQGLVLRVPIAVMELSSLFGGCFGCIWQIGWVFSGWFAAQAMGRGNAQKISVDKF